MRRLILLALVVLLGVLGAGFFDGHKADAAVAVDAGSSATMLAGESAIREPDYPLDYPRPRLGGYCGPIGDYACCLDGSGNMIACFCDARWSPEWGWYGVWVPRTW